MAKRGLKQRFLCAVATILTAQMQMVESAARKSHRTLEIRLTAARMEWTNADYVGPGAFARVTRKSRTAAPAMEAFLPFIRDVPTDLNITYHAFQKINNAWKQTILKGAQKFCSSIESTNKYERMLVDFSDFPKTCPIQKGNYTIKDFRILADELPAIVPPGEWKGRLIWGTPKAGVLTFSMEAKIIHKAGNRQPGDLAGAAVGVADWGNI